MTYKRCQRCGENPCPVSTTVRGGMVISSSMAYCDTCFKLLSVKKVGPNLVEWHFGPDPEPINPETMT